MGQNYHSLNRSPNIIKDRSFTSKRDQIESILTTLPIIEHNVVIQGLLRKLHAAFIHERVAQFYSYFFLGQLSMCSQQRISDSISRELQLLKNKQTQYHLVTKYIQARQICLQLIGQTLQNLFQQNKKADLTKLREQIQHLRRLTSLSILQIREWKNMLLFLSQKVFEDQHIAFYYRNQDYLLKILRDTIFISNSFLSEKVTFSHKQDPFLMRPYDEGQPDNEFINLFKIEPQDKKKYIECLEYLAEQRADYLRRKVVAKQEKIREIERVYQSSLISQRIFATKGIKRIKMTINDVPIDFVEQSPKKQAQDPKIKIRSSSESELRQKKNRLLLIKGQKMKKIKQMDIGSNSPLINIKKFNSVRQDDTNSHPVQRTFSLALLKKRVEKSQKIDKITNQKQTETDFQTLVRRKELQVLETDLSRRRTLSSIKLKDRLSQKKMIDNKEGAQQLMKILDQVEHIALQKQDQLLKNVNQSRVSQSVSILQQNEQNISTLRQKILKEISDDSHLKRKAEEKKREQDEYLQKIIKSKLQQEELKNIQKAKNSWIIGKDKLAQDINKSELFGYGANTSRNTQKLADLEDELKRQMQLKFLREVKAELSHKQEMHKLSANRKKDEKQRDKQLQTALRHKQQEERFKIIEDEQRSKVMMKSIQQQERNKKQMEEQLHKIIQRQQQKLIQKSIEQKQRLQDEMRKNMKQKLLISLKRESSISKKQKQAKQRLKMQQQLHRQEVKKKIQQQFKIQQNIERQRERQQKMLKLKLVSQKMDHLEEEMQKSRIVRQISTQNQDLSRLRETINKIPDFRPTPQTFLHDQQRKKLRQQFELELFAFSKPDNFAPQQNNFLVRQFKNQFDNEQNLDKKIANLAEDIALQKKNESRIEESIKKNNESSLKAIKNDPSVTTDKFVRFSEEQGDKKQKKQTQIEIFTEQQLLKMGIQMSPDEYSVYLKKKNAMFPKRTTPPINEQLLEIKQKIIAEGFHKMNLSNTYIENVQQIKQSHFQEQSQISNARKSSKSKQQYQSPQPRKKEIVKKQRVQQSDDLSDVMKLTVHSKMNSVHKKKFATSDQQEDEKDKKRSKNKKKSKEQRRKIVQSSSSSENTHKSIQKQKFRKQLIAQESKTFRTILADELDDYLLQHFKKLPKIIRKLNLLKKDQLLKSISQYKTVVFIQVLRQDIAQGFIIAVQNQNKQNIRSLNLLHFGCYEVSNTLSLILKGRDLLFSKDPCAEITFSMYFNKQDKQQDNFVKQFEKQFDPYGAIFQKNISNQLTERKHVLRRMIGEQTSKIVKNKNIGQAKILQLMISHPKDQSLGVDLRLQTIGYSLGGWTMLCYYLSNCGEQEKIVKQLSSDVSQQRKNIKHLSKMAMKMAKNRFSDIYLSQYKSPFDANLKLVEEGYDLIKCDPQIQQNKIPITLIKNEISLTPSMSYVAAISQIQHKQSTFECDFFRFKGGKGTKIFKLKSTLYSSVFTILPCKPANYKILIADAHEFDSIAKKTPLDLYLKLFLANISEHSQSSDQQIWLPQVTSKRNNRIEQSLEFGFDIELRSTLDFSFTQYIPNSLTFKPTHRDLFIAPPFIFAVLNSQIEKTVEGSPIFAERIDINDIKGLKDITKPVQSDF